MEKKDLLKIIEGVNTNQNYFGIIPLYPVYIKTDLSLDQFHKLLLELEKEQSIYLEVINDINRLPIEEKNIALYHQSRGYLYYIGLWK